MFIQDHSLFGGPLSFSLSETSRKMMINKIWIQTSSAETGINSGITSSIQILRQLHVTLSLPSSVSHLYCFQRKSQSVFCLKELTMRLLKTSKK